MRTSWTLAVALGVLGLIRPALSVVGIVEGVATPAEVILNIAVISVWIGAVVALRIKTPVRTLILAAAVNAAGIITIEIIRTGLLVDVGVFIVAIGLIEGVLYGLAAMALQKLLGRRPQLVRPPTA